MLKLLTKLAETSSLINKKALLKQADTPLLRKVLIYALDPFRTYGLTQVNICRDAGYGKNGLEDGAFDLLDQLAARELTGSAALAAVQTFIETLGPDEAEVFYRILGRDLRCAVGTTMVNQVWKNLIPLFEVMLAKPADKHTVNWPAYGEPKYDGMRAIFVKQTGQFVSRNGLHIPSVDHLVEEAAKVAAGFDYLDGELVTNGSFNDAIGDLKRKSVKADKAVFQVFDVFNQGTFDGGYDLIYMKRREQLEALSFSDNIKLVPNRLLRDQLDADAFCGEIWGAGGEGIIIKDRNGLYEPKRSAAWLKVKKFETVDLPIVDSYEGKGKYKNQLGGLITDDGKLSADVGGGFSDEERILLWQSRDTLPGKVIEIGYHEVTPDSSLRHPRFIKFRPDKKVA